MEPKALTTNLRRWVAAIGLSLLAGSFAFQAHGQAKIDPQADKVLKAMGAYLASLKTFSVNFDADDEYLLSTGQKLQISASGTVAVERPNKMHATRRGGFADLDITFDGKTFTMYGKAMNAYAQKEIPGALDAMIDTVRDETGFHFSGADFLYSDVAAGLLADVSSGEYWGTTYIGGVECHYLVFRAKDIDWQIWIQTGDKPLPVKFVITSKFMNAAPQFAIRFANWNTAPQLDPKQFAFSPPAGAKKLDGLPDLPSNDFVVEMK